MITNATLRRRLLDLALLHLARASPATVERLLGLPARAGDRPDPAPFTLTASIVPLLGFFQLLNAPLDVGALANRRLRGGRRGTFRQRRPSLVSLR